jgi:hypothetical protein
MGGRTDMQNSRNQGSLYQRTPVDRYVVGLTPSRSRSGPPMPDPTVVHACVRPSDGARAGAGGARRRAVEGSQELAGKQLPTIVSCADCTYA